MYNFMCINATLTESFTRQLLSKFRKVKKKRFLEKADFNNLKPTDSQYFFGSSLFFNKFGGNRFTLV